MTDRAHTRWDGLDRDQLVAELARANRLLSGTLHIVLSTLDTLDVSDLFSRVLEELTETLDASGTIMYMVETDGFHLRGASSRVDAGRVPTYVPFGRTLEAMTTRMGHAMRLRILPPEGSELRQGRLANRRVRDEGSGDTYRVDARTLPPFASLLAVPVWFGQNVIALMEVGWSRAHVMRSEDASLLEAVAQYLSVQLVGAFSAMRQRRESELAEAAAHIQTSLLEGPEIGASEVDVAFGQAAAALACSYLPVTVNVHQPAAMVVLSSGEEALPVDTSALVADEVSVTPIAHDETLYDWLDDAGMPCMGALVCLGRVAGSQRAALLLRQRGSEPFDSTELAFVRRVAQGMRRASAGEEARTQDRRISQALQTGMRNELQHVDGITADAVYSSATAAAFVGGDFYDLIALPKRRACIIMGDVSGKGVEAASVSAAVKTALAAYAWEGLSPARMVALLNDFLLGFSRVETFATLFVGIIDLEAGMLAYCSAGHPPAIVRRGDTGELVALDVQSGLVGAFAGIDYRDGSVRVADGDLLVLYTDGTTEARSPSGAFFGEDGLRDAIVREASGGVIGLPARLLATLDDYTGRNLSDDIAVVAVRVDHTGADRTE